ncbi:dihydroorotase [Methylogaea oryzae]|uniref:Dihydroorotase-like protein n=1 Tax=Methylogaea oryzae TaxID=1295382 RepID=A0A8D4VKV7_9GAMM|nr:dihydroorotase [Methylogaea oryzae]BBL69426.1 dihydroorotase-like protein [Methylogaea oryzae]
MSGRILIRGGRLIDPANGVDAVADLYLADGRVAAVGQAPDGFQADETVDAGGLVVCPGFIDLCARLREPGHTHKATIASETAAAAKAGVTTLCCPPDTGPVIDTPAVGTLIQEKAEQAGKARVLPIGALTRELNGKDLSAMAALKAAGCVAVGNAYQPLANSQVWRHALEYAATHDLLVMIRPEDPWLKEQGCVHEGRLATRLGLPGIPESAETVAVAQALALIEQTGARAHFGQLSCGRAAAMIAEAQSRGVAVSCDVAIHQLHLTEDDVDGFDARCHVSPPLRTAADRDALRLAVASGAIAALCSDHQPHEPDAKLDTFLSTEPGMAALETLLPLTLRLVELGLLSLPAALERLSAGPARILGLPRAGLAVGDAADVCVFDANQVWKAEGAHWASRGRNTPFWGQEMRGAARLTLLAGETVYRADNR